MNRLWIFGDSFSTNATMGNPHPVENQWHRLVAKSLHLDTSYHGHNGASLDWLYHTWSQTNKDMTAGDVAVIAVTDFNRRWFFPKYPSIATLRAIDVSPYKKAISEKQAKAVYMYTRFLHHNTAQPALLTNWLYSAAAAADRGVSVVILPAFEDVAHELSMRSGKFPQLHIAKGFLFEPSVKEYKIGWQDHRLMKTEGRSCHFTAPNHRVIADKILSCLNDGVFIDLTTGFHECLINENNLDSKELFIGTHYMVDSAYEIKL